MRDKMIHEYFGVNLQLVWDAIEQEVPRVWQKIEAILREWDVGRGAEGGTREAETRGAIAPVRHRRSLRQIHLRRPRGFNDRLIEQISAFNPELTNPNHILESLPSQYRDLSPAAVAAPRTAGVSPTETIKAELTRLRKERAGLLTRYTARHPDVVKIDRQIEESEALLAASMKAVDPAKHGTVDAEQQRLLPLQVPGSPGTKAGHAANVLSITSSSQGIIHEQIFRVNATD